MSYFVKRVQSPKRIDLDENQRRQIALSKSRFRTRFCLDESDQIYIATVGLPTIQLHAFDFVRKRLAPAEPKNDGKQTPFRGHPVFKAQHATATCCRACLKKWYRIKKGRPLTDSEIELAVDAIMTWINERERASSLKNVL